MSYPFQREYYRILYPLQERPQLVLQEEAYEVVDCSERGLRYCVPKAPLPAIGATVQGQLRFRRGAAVTIQGNVVRIQDDEVAIHFPSAQIPLSVLFDEQRYLRMNYPMWQ
jgi:hypothetical protein